MKVDPRVAPQVVDWWRAGGRLDGKEITRADVSGLGERVGGMSVGAASAPLVSATEEMDALVNADYLYRIKAGSRWVYGRTDFQRWIRPDPPAGWWYENDRLMAPFYVGRWLRLNPTKPAVTLALPSMAGARANMSVFRQIGVMQRCLEKAARVCPRAAVVVLPFGERKFLDPYDGDGLPALEVALDDHPSVLGLVEVDRVLGGWA